MLYFNPKNSEGSQEMLKGSKLYPEIIFSCWINYSSLKMNIAPSKYIIRNWNILSAARPGKGCYSSYCIPHLAWGLTHNAYSTNVCTVEHITVLFSDDNLFQGRRTLLYPFIERVACFPETV